MNSTVQQVISHTSIRNGLSNRNRIGFPISLKTTADCGRWQFLEDYYNYRPRGLVFRN
jgi:hypothetical protein